MRFSEFDGTVEPGQLLCDVPGCPNVWMWACVVCEKAVCDEHAVLDMDGDPVCATHALPPLGSPHAMVVAHNN